MRKIITASGLIMLLLSLSFNASAAESTFSVDYAPDNPTQGPSLVNATLNIKLYANGSPQGSYTVKTDVLKQFKLNVPEDPFLVVVVRSILNEPDDTRCHGYTTPGSTRVMIKCHKLSDAAQDSF